MTMSDLRASIPSATVWRLHSGLSSRQLQSATRNTICLPMRTSVLVDVVHCVPLVSVLLTWNYSCGKPGRLRQLVKLLSFLGRKGPLFTIFRKSEKVAICVVVVDRGFLVHGFAAPPMLKAFWPSLEGTCSSRSTPTMNRWRRLTTACRNRTLEFDVDLHEMNFTLSELNVNRENDLTPPAREEAPLAKQSQAAA